MLVLPIIQNRETYIIITSSSIIIITQSSQLGRFSETLHKCFSLMFDEVSSLEMLEDHVSTVYGSIDQRGGSSDRRWFVFVAPVQHVSQETSTISRRDGDNYI